MSPAPTPSPLPLSTSRSLPLHQPFVHDLDGVLHAPVQAWSQPSGFLQGVGAEGIYLGDTRVVSQLLCTAEGAELSPLSTQVRSAREVEFRDVVSLADGVVDPLLTLHRTRTATAEGISEELRLASDDDRPRRLRLHLGLVTDAASMSAVKDPRLLAATGDARPRPVLEGSGATWPIGVEGGTARLALEPGSAGPDLDGPTVTWIVDLEAPPRGEAVTSWQLALDDPAVPFAAAEISWTGAVLPTAATAPAASPEVRAAQRLLHRSLSDLDALRLQAPGDPSQAFFAAGAPWFFTLFGRDSLLTALLALPVDRTVAETTLRTLAHRQGTVVDAETAEQPGKILHEVRAAGMEMADAHLPPVYYGTIDATPLWIELLHATRAAGLEDAVLAELRPALEAAATWLLEHADADGDGLLEYIDESGHGLTNQGWKDSGDSIRLADGSLAEGAIALAEVQGYAYAAALHAAELLEDPALTTGAATATATDTDTDTGTATDPGAPLPQRLRDWAGVLKERFHRAFWCEDELGPFVALALDGAKRPVDGVASNMGHLLGTGLLDAAQERLVVDRLLHPSMFSGYGVRTLSTTNGGYGPLRYHGGSVWSHDTGFILRGMLRCGFVEEGRVLARGLLRAADGFELRLPELFSGESADSLTRPVPYPASCRPQAWAAASAIPLAQALDAL